MNKERKLKLARLRKPKEVQPETVAQEVSDQLADKAVMNRLDEDMGTIKDSLTAVADHLLEDNTLDELKDELKSIEEIVSKEQTVSVNVDTSKLEEIVAKIQLQPEISTGDVIVDTALVAKELKALDKSLKAAVAANKPESIKKDLTRLIKAVEDKAQDPTDFIPVRRVIKQGNRLIFDDTRTSAGGSFGGTSSSSSSVLDAVTWGIARIDDSLNPSYYGFEDNDANWYILRENSITGEWKYVVGTGGIETVWSDRATQTYVDKGAAF